MLPRKSPAFTNFLFTKVFVVTDTDLQRRLCALSINTENFGRRLMTIKLEKKPYYRQAFCLTIILFLAALSANLVNAQSPTMNAEEWYLPTEDKAAQLYVYEIGQGEPVVVLHGGFGAEHSYLLDAVKGLEKKYHFIFYDQRGSLRSPCKTDQITFDKHVEDLETLRKSLGLDKITLFSHSMGTMLAVGYLRKYPEHVKNIVMAGALVMKSGKYMDDAYKASVLNMNDAGERMGKRPEVTAELEKIGYKNPNLTAKQRTYVWRIRFAGAAIYHIDRWREMKGGMVFYNEEAGTKASSSLFKQLTNDYDFSPDIEKHPFPITVISGDHDYADFNNAFFKRYSTEVKNLRLFIIKDAGHNAWIDNPKAFRKALDEGLGKKRIM
jgi:proline-specific peptidase